MAPFSSSSAPKDTLLRFGLKLEPEGIAGWYPNVENGVWVILRYDGGTSYWRYKNRDSQDQLGGEGKKEERKEEEERNQTTRTNITN